MVSRLETWHAVTVDVNSQSFRRALSNLCAFLLPDFFGPSKHCFNMPSVSGLWSLVSVCGLWLLAVGFDFALLAFDAWLLAFDF